MIFQNRKADHCPEERVPSAIIGFFDLPLKDWPVKPMIFVSQLAMGRRHFWNRRRFMPSCGLPGLIEVSQLAEDQQKLVFGGILALYVVRWMNINNKSLWDHSDKIESATDQKEINSHDHHIPV